MGGQKTITWKGEKSYKSKGWAQRKISDLQDENKFYEKYGNAPYGPNHWNTNIRVEERRGRHIVCWDNNMIIPVKEEN